MCTAAYRVRAGRVTGRGHLLDGSNCQDAHAQLAFEHTGQRYLCGVVTDGCGSGACSEVGAQLGAHVISREIRRLVEVGTPVEELAEPLFERLLSSLRGLLAACRIEGAGERTRFVADFLLFTVGGFLVAPRQTLIFAAGDGVVLLNDALHLREQQNAPAYPGYLLLTGPDATSVPARFDCYTLPTTELERLAIGSDAWIAERTLLEQLGELRRPASLQLRMNRWSAAQHFQDDATLIVVERETSLQKGGAP